MKIAKFDSDSDDDRNVQEDNYAVVQAELITAFRARKSEPLGSDPLYCLVSSIGHHKTTYLYGCNVKL